MKISFFFFTFYFLFVHDALASSKGPVEVSIYPFCTIEKTCEMSIVLRNITNYDIEVYSPNFENNTPHYSGVFIYSGDKYMARDFNTPLINNIPIKKREKHLLPLTASNRITFAPLEVKAFNLDSLETVYDLEYDNAYAINFGTLHASYFIRGKYVGKGTLSSPTFTFLRFPKENLKPFIKLN